MDEVDNCAIFWHIGGKVVLPEGKRYRQHDVVQKTHTSARLIMNWFFILSLKCHSCVSIASVGI